MYSKNLLAAEVIKKINQKSTKTNNERLSNILSIIVSLLSQGFSEEGLISPRVVNETKRASLAYLAAY
jgi:predicted house-cleaning noncanonical NTP pyrophosphatase (MazG superfamily)